MESGDGIVVCGMVIRPHEHIVVVRGHTVDLTSREFDVLMKLAEHPGWVFSAEQLSSGNEDGDYSPESVSVLVSRVRHKLAAAGALDVIETVRGAGYRVRPAACEGADATDPATETRAALREAAWDLQAAVFEVAHSGTEEQRQTAIAALDAARRTIYTALAE